MHTKIRLIVPAAGAGTRMGLSYPKTLFSIAGQPILGHILQAAAGIVDDAVVVASPTGRAAIQEYLDVHSPMPAQVVVQERPVGMADAVWVGTQAPGCEAVADYLIIWGDQATVRHDTLARIADEHRASNAALTFPTSARVKPYIHIMRGTQGQIQGVLEAREGDQMPDAGESDCGVFLARGELLADGIKELRSLTWDATNNMFLRLDGTASRTGEFNFLPLITLWAKKGLPTQALLIAQEQETIGINNPDEAAIVERQS